MVVRIGHLKPKEELARPWERRGSVLPGPFSSPIPGLGHYCATARVPLLATEA